MTKEEYEIELRKLELKQKQLEVEKIQLESKNKSRILTPVFGTIIIALVGVFGTIISNIVQKDASLAIERQKFQFDIYSKAQSAGSPEKAAQILDFYVRAKLIPGNEGEFTDLIKDGEAEKVPILRSDPIPISNRIKEVYGDLEIPKPTEEEELRINKDYFLTGKNVDYYLSPNTSSKFENGYPDAIIFHFAASSSRESSVKYLSNRIILSSIHFMIGKDGFISQLIPLNYVAWGAGKSEYDNRTNWNKYSIHIDFVNAGVLEKRGSDYISYFGKKYKEEDVFYGKDKFGSESLYWEKYTKEQILSAKKLCEVLIRNYDIKYILGHDDIAKGRKRDPGPAFPLKDFQDMLK